MNEMGTRMKTAYFMDAYEYSFFSYIIMWGVSIHVLSTNFKMKWIVFDKFCSIHGISIIDSTYWNVFHLLVILVSM